MEILGIDVGGSGIKAAIVEVSTGDLVSRHRHFVTPQPATPEALIRTIGELVADFHWQGPVGCGFPAVVSHGIVRTAANIDPSWIGIDIESLLKLETGCQCHVVNDADAAGLAEVKFGSAENCSGSVLMLTLGTGIGSALFYDGELFPNLELGALPFQGSTAEGYAAASVRTAKKLSWQAWSTRLNSFFVHVERMLSPELIVIGGGVSQRHEKFFHLLDTRAPIVPARLFNLAGIVGAAHFAFEQESSAG
ncbi:MAG: ROK family protein [Desulfuromonadales bacterium]|nr:ROK family protein [Desulfuromonadales bacterium]MBN2791836.1 ROK family protein [Desulfuromonadales bacterium]